MNHLTMLENLQRQEISNARKNELRLFAGMAMQGILSNPAYDQASIKNIAELSLATAKTLQEELDRNEK